jgi:hypothetical protein
MKKSSKKPVKVKSKDVKSKTNKVKSPVSKKKIQNKKVVKYVKKTRRRKKKISMEDIYPILNKVQLGKKKITFAIYMIDAPTVENNIKDIGLVYKKIEMRTQVIFTVYPDTTNYEEDSNIKLEIMDDEIPDIDQIFG